ncbi:GAF domain-containing sensor histidine kinase [Novosphingobium sp. 9]|uniref:sensor histidine kinase n=1 Tax=Novosphingobium sp. 9 TaxID=2025349 RepID=UPI0021B61A14|nr:ATP-binding protein [Novosphingobium sp. 9]
MTSSQGPNSQILLAFALPLILGLCLLTDITLPLGTGVSVLYLLPTVIAYAGKRPVAPIATAIGGLGCVTLAYFYAPDGVAASIAIMNRVLSGATNVLVAIIGASIIHYRNRNRHAQALRVAEAELARTMAGEVPLDELGHRAITFLAEQFGASAGALFAHEDGQYRRIATVGVPQDANIPRTTSPDDGLLGEVIRTGNTIHLADVPAGYLEIGSALGRAVPRALVIGAAQVDGFVNAVIELGFLDQPNARPEDVSEFLDLVGGPLGIALRSAKYRSRLEHLLAETQNQAEELQAQSEELRASNDELEAQSKQLLDSQTELEQQQAELERSNAQLEEQTASLEAQRDELARAQSRLRGQADDLEQASRYKSEFLANMSHELRTPLNSLLIMARLLADNRSGNLSGEQVRFAETIETAGNDLLALINDVLDISKIEAGRIDLDLHETSLATLLAKLRDTFAPGAERKGLNLTMSVAPEAPASLETDPLRLEQILKNFLSNALKFTDAGSVELAIRSTGNDTLAFTVRDSGPGIAPEQQQAIFEAFRQADGGIARKYGGTGLGLSISRELARLLGGQISLESEPGKGSAFTLTLPCTFAGSREAAQAPVRQQETIRPSAATPAPRSTGSLHATSPRMTAKRSPAIPASFWWSRTIRPSPASCAIWRTKSASTA